jgi:hypothetical protein
MTLGESVNQGTARIGSDAVLAAAVLLLGLLLADIGQHLLRLWEDETLRGQSAGFEHILGMTSSFFGVFLVGWWILTFLMAVAAAILQKYGLHGPANATRRFSPAFMRRLAVALLSLNLFGIPLANASSNAMDPSWRTAVGTGTVASAPVTADSQDATSARQSGSGPDPQWKPRPPAIEPGLMGGSPQRIEEAPDATKSVVVVVGDSLWTIAARHLGPLATDLDIALSWPQWYEANRSVIGDDPSILKPGQVLQPPKSPYPSITVPRA